MISLWRPDDGQVAGYRRDRLDAEPTCKPEDATPRGFRRDLFSRTIATGSASLERARLGIESWAAHRGSGVDIYPAEAPIKAGETVAIMTRQLGLWVLAACRIESVVNEPSAFGFTYATLPDHPECGYESFIVRLEGDTITFQIEAVSRPGVPIVRLGAPVTRELQRRASNGYLAALQRWMESGG